ncbi:hypothetical protein JYT77_00105 [bacterium AH-315-K15]|nr:hypothetical protein [bacterium AH-315-K15]
MGNCQQKTVKFSLYLYSLLSPPGNFLPPGGALAYQNQNMAIKVAAVAAFEIPILAVLSFKITLNSTHPVFPQNILFHSPLKKSSS